MTYCFSQNLKIAIAEPSVIVRSGLAVALKRIPGIHAQTFEISSQEFLANYINCTNPIWLIVKPALLGDSGHEQTQRRSRTPDFTCCIAPVTGALDDNFLKQYDEKFSLYDSVDQLRTKLNKVFEAETIEPDEETDTLSVREKEILTCVVKGQTNKEIAQSLFLSTHTVITHRRLHVTRSTACRTHHLCHCKQTYRTDDIKKDL